MVVTTAIELSLPNKLLQKMMYKERGTHVIFKQKYTMLLRMYDKLHTSLDIEMRTFIYSPQSSRRAQARNTHWACARCLPSSCRNWKDNTTGYFNTLLRSLSATANLDGTVYHHNHLGGLERPLAETGKTGKLKRPFFVILLMVLTFLGRFLSSLLYHITKIIPR